MIKFILILFITFYSDISSQTFLGLSDIHDPIDTALVRYLEDNNIGKVRYYYDKKFENDGQWDLYPNVYILNNIIAIAASSIDSVDGYSFLLFIELNPRMQIIDFVGPYYDSSVNAVSINNEDGTLIVRLVNPPEPSDPIYTLVTYKRVKGKFKEMNIKDIE